MESHHHCGWRQAGGAPAPVPNPVVQHRRIPRVPHPPFAGPVQETSQACRPLATCKGGAEWCMFFASLSKVPAARPRRRQHPCETLGESRCTRKLQLRLGRQLGRRRRCGTQNVDGNPKHRSQVGTNRFLLSLCPALGGGSCSVVGMRLGKGREQKKVRHVIMRRKKESRSHEAQLGNTFGEAHCVEAERVFAGGRSGGDVSAGKQTFFNIFPPTPLRRTPAQELASTFDRYLPCTVLCTVLEMRRETISPSKTTRKKMRPVLLGVGVSTRTKNRSPEHRQQYL